MLLIHFRCSVGPHNKSRSRSQTADDILQSFHRNVSVMQVFKEDDERLSRPDSDKGTSEQVKNIGAVLNPFGLRANGHFLTARNLIHFRKNRKQCHKIRSEIGKIDRTGSGSRHPGPEIFLNCFAKSLKWKSLILLNKTAVQNA